MRNRLWVVFPVVLTFFPGTLLTAQVAREHQVALKNWPAPLYFQPTPAEAERPLGPVASSPTAAEFAGVRRHDSLPGGRHARRAAVLGGVWAAEPSEGPGPSPCNPAAPAPFPRLPRHIR